MPPKNETGRARRTVKACVICHKKKIRCDIDEVSGDVCTPCAKDGYQCVPRERKRKRFTFSPSPPVSRTRTRSADGKNVENAPTTMSTSTTYDQSFSETSHVLETSAIPGGTVGRGLSGTTYTTDDSPVPVQSEGSSCPATRQSVPAGIFDTTRRPSKAASYLGRLEYLRNDVPVNDDAGLPNKVPRQLSDTDLAILRAQGVSDLPPSHIRASLMEAFWTRCYPWTPVVKREWVEDPQSSLLLQHAMMLAGSRVTPVYQEYPPLEFYKKAKVLFWTGTEEDPIIMIAATLLLHWWNPEGPESVSIDTSSFWLRICVGLAYQVGLHREPVGKPDAGLRKRIWWSLVVRDCLINAGHGRPRAIDLKLADVSPVSALDFEGATEAVDVFSAYVEISCILGNLTQSYLRKHGLQEQKKSLEDRLFRWLKTLPDHLQLCYPTDSWPLKEFSIEAWSLHIQYFTVVIILNRSPDGKSSPSAASLLASSFIAGLFADLMAREQLQYLGPIFTFYCLTAGMAQLSCYRYTEIIQTAEDNLLVLKRALEELGKRWPTAVGSLKHLLDVREKVMQKPSLGQFPEVSMPASTAQFFSNFGSDLCRMWFPIYQRLPQKTSREMETAGILHGLRTPATQAVDLDMASAAAMRQQMMQNQGAETALEPTMLQPQEWFGPYGGMANWLMADWGQGLGW